MTPTPPNTQDAKPSSYENEQARTMLTPGGLIVPGTRTVHVGSRNAHPRVPLRVATPPSHQAVAALQPLPTVCPDGTSEEPSSMSLIGLLLRVIQHESTSFQGPLATTDHTRAISGSYQEYWGDFLNGWQSSNTGAMPHEANGSHSASLRRSRDRFESDRPLTRTVRQRALRTLLDDAAVAVLDDDRFNSGNHRG